MGAFYGSQGELLPWDLVFRRGHPPDPPLSLNIRSYVLQVKGNVALPIPANAL